MLFKYLSSLNKKEQFNFSPPVVGKETKEPQVIINIFRAIDQDIMNLYTDFPIADVFSTPYIIFHRVYGWPSLKQTGYKINIDLCDLISSADRKTSYDSMKIDDIKIEESETKITNDILLYVNDQALYMLNYMKQFIDSDDNSVRGNFILDSNYVKLGSKRISKLLSLNSIYDSNGSIEGNSNIFESDELIDQLLIYLMMEAARCSVNTSQNDPGVPINILLSLLFDNVKDHVKSYNNNNEELDNKWINDILLFLIKVIRGETSKNYEFPFNNKMSLKFWFVGRNGSEKDQSLNNKWHPKIREYIRDYLLTPKEEGDLECPYPAQSDETNNEDGNTKEPEDKKNIMMDKAELGVIFKGLDSRSKEIAEAYYLEGKTQKEIGEERGLTEARISQILKEIKGKHKN